MNPWGPGLEEPDFQAGLAGGPPPGLFPALLRLQGELKELEGRLHALQQVLQRALRERVDTAPLHLDIAHLDKVEFRFDRIEVDELSGELNIGFTHALKPQSPQRQPGQPPPPQKEGESPS